MAYPDSADDCRALGPEWAGRRAYGQRSAMAWHDLIARRPDCLGYVGAVMALTRPAYTRCKAPELTWPWPREVDPKHAVMAEAFAKIRDARPAPEPVIDIIRLRAQIALLSDDDFTALVVTEAGRRGMTDLWRKLP